MSEKKFFIAGVQHHRLHEVLNELNVGDRLAIIPEPTNKYDPNAIRLEHGGVMCGYVPARFSAEISGLIEVGLDLECVITTFNKTAKPWEMCEVVIRGKATDDTEESS